MIGRGAEGNTQEIRTIQEVIGTLDDLMVEPSLTIDEGELFGMINDGNEADSLNQSSYIPGIIDEDKLFDMLVNDMHTVKPVNPGYSMSDIMRGDELFDTFSDLRVPGLSEIVVPDHKTSQSEIAFSAFKDISDFHPPELKENTEDQDTDLEANEALIEDQGKPAGKVRRIISTALFYGFIISLIGGAFFLSQGTKTPIFGYSFMNVLTWSMQQEIPQGSMVIIKQVDPNIIKIGDNITYMQDEETAITHKVIGITENYEDTGARGFETKGVNNEVADFEIVHAENVVGVVKYHIPRLGAWLDWLRINLILVLCFTGGIILLVILVAGALKKDPEEQQVSPVQPVKAANASPI